jgi:hypothetical protein
LGDASLPPKKPAKVNIAAFPSFGALKKPTKGNVVALPSFGATGSSLGGASLPLKKPAKGNTAAFPSFGMTGSSLCGTSLPLKKPAKVNDVDFSSFSVTAWAAVAFYFLSATECVAASSCLLSVTARMVVAFFF